MSAHAFEPPGGSEPRSALRDLAVREHSLLALFELSRELSVRVETARVVDLALFNLMGHFGTRQSALWLASAGGEPSVALVRGHGISTSLGGALAAAFARDMDRWSAGNPEPVRMDEAAERMDEITVAAARHAGLALVAPLPAHGAVIGFVALGRRADGADASSFELEVLRSSLGMLGVAIENSRLYHELQERSHKLAEAYRDLMELDQMKNEFVQNVNHELRTPLTIMQGAIECLLEPPDADARRNELLHALAGQTRKLADMVHSLLDLTSIIHHEEGLRLVDVSTTEFLERYAATRAERVSAGGRLLCVTPGRRDVRARIAPPRLTKVLDLLLENSVKFTPPGSRITLTASPGTGEPGTEIIFSDDGPGIPAEELPRIFRPFYQVDGSSTRTAGGLGIGLAVAQRLVASMGGRIEAECPPTGGTSFRILVAAP